MNITASSAIGTAILTNAGPVPPLTQAAPATPVSASPYTWEAIAEIQPIVHIGTKEDCEAWARAMGRMEVSVTDADGKSHVVGVVSSVSWKAIL